MKKLLDQEELYLSPIDTPFDINEIKAFIAQLGFSLEHPTIPLLFLICSDEQFKISTESSLKNNYKFSNFYLELVEGKTNTCQNKEINDVLKVCPLPKGN